MPQETSPSTRTHEAFALGFRAAAGGVDVEVCLSRGACQCVAVARRVSDGISVDGLVAPMRPARTMELVDPVETAGKARLLLDALRARICSAQTKSP